MSNKKTVYLTEVGLEELKKELDHLKLEKRPEIIAALKDARAQGDLSENAEYDAAHYEQHHRLRRRSRRREILRHQVPLCRLKALMRSYCCNYPCAEIQRRRSQDRAYSRKC